MKRVGYIWEKITDIENIKWAHKNARKDKAFYKEVRMVDANLDYYAAEIHKMLINKEYRVSDYRVQIINDKGKERKLMKLQYYPDRIIQWAVMLQLEPIFLRMFCKHTCASIPNRGIKRARNLVLSYLKDKEGTKYCFKMDVRKFYDNINHDILKQKLRRILKDNDLLWLLDKIIDSYPGNVGVPIGSYLSQYFANFYLTAFDHYLKEDLRVKYCVRYMDDVVIFAESKEKLHYFKDRIIEYLHNEALELKRNYQIFAVDVRGVDFVGFRFFHNYALLRKKTKKRMKLLKSNILHKYNQGVPITLSEFCAVNSYAGWLSMCNSYGLWNKYIDPVKNAIFKYYWNMIYNSDKKGKGAALRKYKHNFNKKKGVAA